VRAHRERKKAEKVADGTYRRRGRPRKADGAEVRLYGTERTRTLEIVATAPLGGIPELTDLAPEIPEPLSPEITELTTGRTPR